MPKTILLLLLFFPFCVTAQDQEIIKKQQEFKHKSVVKPQPSAVKKYSNDNSGKATNVQVGPALKVSTKKSK
jgi:hypothetical protein